ncbi:unnamed protein product [Tilletia laevis]|uniref:Asp/Glu/hydantoin racemase n=2 Tax=Tilletia TaxID=13289 RepID=A0A177UGP6_9BASI|nr:hypothetical protein CF336_g4450 [Tilletia laevis]KAE8260047.1 hypothetical protein A4X03_0g3928 [Tilletia caries]CAD6900900.1 unnamed protein product [Tilletia controversa]KAE8205442.1 hypothetical protein CF335_g2295 [Tilletia laevis]CAD6892827.1 unnamed protein product [Tilletia caries]
MTSLPSTLTLAVVNPNSSDVITKALEKNLTASQQDPNLRLTFHTGPPTSPPSINNPIDAVLSATHTFSLLLRTTTTPSPDAYLICCFSNHPLAGMLRHEFPRTPCMHILEAAVLHALPLGTRFGVITTGADAVSDIDRGVRDVLGANSYRYIGTLSTGLGVVELQTGDPAKVQAVLKEHAAKLANMGADAIILGCAGMTGMEDVVRQGAQSALPPGKQVAVIDGAKAGVQLLSGLARCNYYGA